MSTSDTVKHEAKGWGGIILVGIALIMFGPALLATGLNMAAGEFVDNAPKLGDAAKPIPGNANRLNEQARRAEGATTATTATPRTLSAEELAARQQAKQIGDGLAAAKAQPVPAPDPRGGLPKIGEAGNGSVLGRLIPGAEGAVRAIGPGLAKALNP